jgi:hypothetical protein
MEESGSPDHMFELFTCGKDETAPNCAESNDIAVSRCKTCQLNDNNEIECNPDAVPLCREDDPEIFEFNGFCLHKQGDVVDCASQRDDSTYVDEACGPSCIDKKYTPLSLNF